MAAACLAHDIGHPPFGHAGEEAIRHWFTIDRPELLNEDCTPNEKADLSRFESNTQGFRILTRLQFWRHDGGMRLCCATLAALSKYPNSSYQEGTGGTVKFGYYQDDLESFLVIAKSVGLPPHPALVGAWSRHPLSYLVEAADDICYLIVDLEDGFKSKRLSFKDVDGALATIARGDIEARRKRLDPGDQVAYLRSRAIGVLIDQALDVFLSREKQLLAGTFRGVLLDHITLSRQVQQIRAMCKKTLYDDERKLKVEMAGFSIVRGLLEFYSDALLAWERAGYQQEHLRYFYQKTLHLLPDLASTPKRRYSWLLGMTDYVSGMTDGFALDQFRQLCGVTLRPWAAR